MLQGVEVGDAEAVRDEAAGGTSTTRPDHDPALPREVVEVPHDEEVGRVASRRDDGQLLLRALHGCRRRFSEPPIQTFDDQLPQVLVGGQPIGNVERRQQGRAQRDLQVHLVRDLEGGRPTPQELAGEYASGIGSYRLARKYGLSPATVRARLRAVGVALRPARQATRGPSAEEVARLHATGIGVRELARRFGVSHVTILNRLKRARDK